MDTDMFDDVPPTLNPNVTSSITYSPSAPLTDLGFVPLDFYKEMPDTTLVPIPVEPQLPPATKTLTLEVLFETVDDGTNRAMFNQVTWNPPKVPAIFSALSLGPNATVEKAYGPGSFVVEYGDIVDLVIQNGDAGKHPFHLHGHKFQIVGRAEDYLSDDPEKNPKLVEGQANPIRRDTVQIPGGHSATLRLVADNPGVWLMHCEFRYRVFVCRGVN